MSEQQTISPIIRRRRTWKVLSDAPVSLSEETTRVSNEQVRTAVIDASFAPFHYDRKHNELVEPFRFHILWESQCREIAVNFSKWFPEAKPSNKLPKMLNCCGALVIVNWLPEFDWADTNEQRRQVNEEHLMAASAATQNLLISLTAAGLGSYWSSGGQFRLDEMKSRLQIPLEEKMVGGIFVEYPDPAIEGLEKIGGKHHPNRSKTDEIIRELTSVN